MVDVSFWILAIVGTILTGISKSGFASGAGTLAVPLMALAAPIEQVVVIMLPVLILMDSKNVSLYFRDIPWQRCIKLLLAAAVGISIGGMLINKLSGNVLAIILGVLCIVFAFWQSLSKYLSQMRGLSWLWGTISGMTSTLLHAGGPPINMYLITLSLPKVQWIAITSIFFAAMNWLKVIPYSINGLFDQSLFITSLWLMPAAYLGIVLGHKLQAIISEAQFVKACKILLACSGLGLIIPRIIV